MKRDLPAAPQMLAQTGISFDLLPSVLQRWNPALRAQDEEQDNTISIFDPIGRDYWTGEGVTAKRVAAALRSIGADKDVVVNINSPGGDYFEGLAIYNLLRAHEGNVTVRVLGVAASAASVIAMAGNEIEIGRAAFFMIHNAWIVVAGDRLVLRDAADWLEPFDAAAADIYAARSGQPREAVAKMLDAEKWIGGQEAVDTGFADALLSADQIKEDDTERDAQASSVRRVDALLAKCGVPRSERRKLIQEIKAGTRDAAGSGMQDAADPGLRLATGGAMAISASMRSVFST